MAHPFVSELEIGCEVEGVFVASSISFRSFRDASRGNFLLFRLGDRSGTLSAVAWDTSESWAAILRDGTPVSVRARVELHEGSPQLNVKALTILDPSAIDPADLLPVGPRDSAVMLRQIRQVVDETVRCPHLRGLLDRFLDSEDITPRLLLSPAAKRLHHAYVGGLVEHIAGCLFIATNVWKVHKALDRELLCAGIVLHDIGKIIELSAVTHIDYTTPGRLIGHVVLGYEWVMAEIAAMPGFPEHTRWLLGHLILSHHGSKEMGAPVLPMTPEAVALHDIENADAQANRILGMVLPAREGGQEFTEFDRLLDRRLYARPREPGSEA